MVRRDECACAEFDLVSWETNVHVRCVSGELRDECTRAGGVGGEVRDECTCAGGVGGEVRDECACAEFDLVSWETNVHVRCVSGELRDECTCAGGVGGEVRDECACAGFGW